MKKIYSSPSLFGGINYYDESGHQIGYSTEGLFGGRNFYDESGHHVGYSTEALFGGENYSRPRMLSVKAAMKPDTMNCFWKISSCLRLT